MNHNSLQYRAIRLFRCVGFALLLPCALPVQAGTQALANEKQKLTVEGKSRSVRVPKGYLLEWLGGMDGPRMLTFAANGDLFAGSRSGRVYRLPPPYTKAEVLVELGDYPHSVAFRPGEILIARTHGVYRAPYSEGQSRIARDDVSLLAALPGGAGHDSRTVGVGPDGRVYVSLGIKYNCSDQFVGVSYPPDDQRGGVMVLRERDDEADWVPYASGLRNPVGFAWQPDTGVMFAGNNGPDHLGYDLPPEYFSRLDAGSFHGMPWFQYDGKQLQRDDCVESTPPRPINEVMPPVATFPSRNAPLGVTFVPKGAMEVQLELDAVVALHGSWGTKPGGGFIGRSSTRRPPKLVVVRFQDGQAVRVDDLVTGFQLPDGKRWARPAGVAVGPDGALYFSSDSETNGLFRLKRVR
ncbi:MAG: PQQ-dependent sugar dehydrogenase [Gammaproteobacteria bacterium]|nr:PQQ-dependent sugar dehydrogenase [Gammaproteobacteria bacterium]MBU1776719.1 PQQ-dependent sugar dehydrogenase [Gammaproteobacteria bacterium]MBU1969490.1 PQQ-dependent sugar dehydrogenase [Gammaproteobacteria bacterium]